LLPYGKSVVWPDPLRIEREHAPAQMVAFQGNDNSRAICVMREPEKVVAASM
jgi:hypothetical protein